jgi:nicotinic acid mononucleotide adenylyltransferase
MCRLAFQSIPRVVVSNLEQVCYDQYTQATGNTRGFGTVDLLDILLPQEPDTDFYLALGADTFMDLTSGKWKRAKEIIHRIQGRMVVFQRWVDATGILNQVQTQPLVSEPQLRERIHQVQDSLQDPAMEGMESRDRIGSDLLRFPLWIHIPNLSAVSSSLARSMDREDSLGRIVSSQVLSYVKEQALYTFAMETEGQ